jgi:hypothetical protein
MAERGESCDCFAYWDVGATKFTVCEPGRPGSEVQLRRYAEQMKRLLEEELEMVLITRCRAIGKFGGQI